MKLNKIQKGFILPLFVLGFIGLFSIFRYDVSIRTVGIVSGIVISFFVPYLIFSNKILSEEKWYQSPFLWISNIIFVINWIMSCFLFYRESNDVTFIEFYKPHFSSPDSFTAVMFGGLAYCIFMANFVVKNIYKDKGKLEL